MKRQGVAKSVKIELIKTLMRVRKMVTYDEYVETGLIALNYWLSMKAEQSDAEL